MNKRMQAAPKKLLDPTEYALIEALAFGPTLMETAFLVGSGVAKSFVQSYSTQIRGAKTHEELAEVLARAAERAPLFTGGSLGGFSDRVEAEKRGKLQERECGLRAEAERRTARGLPSLYNRWSDSWCETAAWRAVPFVDAALTPVHHAAA
jgi:hypothetical protein